MITFLLFLLFPLISFWCFQNLDNMSSSMSLLRNSIPWIAVLVPPYLLFASFSEYGLVLSISITSFALIVSTIAFKFSKQKHTILNESVQEEEVAPQVEQIVSDQQPQNGKFGKIKDVLADKKSRNENNAKEEKVQVDGGVVQIHDLYSESESLGGRSSSSEDSDIDWLFSGHSPLCSDGSISDEESLIEIALPSGHFVASEKDLSFQHHQKVFADLAPKQQNCLMDFLADINDVYEEENFIEIDISMGSIKCSRFEIPA